MRPPDEGPSHHALHHARTMHAGFILATGAFAMTLLTAAGRDGGAPHDAPAATPVVAAVGIVALLASIFATRRIARAREALPSPGALRAVEHWTMLRLAGAVAIAIAGLWGSYARGGAVFPFLPAAAVAVAAALAFFPRRAAFGVPRTSA